MTTAKSKDRQQIGRRSRAKGKRGELEAAAIFRDAGYNSRRAQQYSGKADGTADIIGVPGFHIEVKRVERLNLAAAYQQSKDDAETAGRGEVPIVVHRRSRGAWMVSLSLADFIGLIGRSREEGGQA